MALDFGTTTTGLGLNIVDTPNFTGVIDQNFFIEPLGGAAHPFSYLDRFPESVYNVSPLSHLVKFLYIFLGPSGVGGFRKNYLQARLMIEEHGIDLFNLDNFYGDPIGFGRLLEEQYQQDPNGLLTQEQWDKVKTKDASYRNRAIDFMNAARAGSSPTGVYLAARSGIGHNVEVLENYKYLYDQHSDDPMNLPSYGTTQSTEEIIILPRQDISKSAQQVISISSPPSGGFFTLSFDGHQTQPIAPTASRLDIQNFLESLPNIDKGNVIVTGGPGPNIPWQISFTGSLGSKSVPQLVFNNSLLTGISLPSGSVTTTYGGTEAVDETVDIPPKDQHYLLEALGRVKPVTTIPSFQQASGTRSRVLWKNIAASSEFTEVIRFVTGNVTIAGSWLQANIENEAPKLVTGRSHHYMGFHTIVSIDAYTNAAINDPNYNTANWSFFKNNYTSEHFGSYNATQRSLYGIFNNDYYTLTTQKALNCVEAVPWYLSISDAYQGTTLVNDWYPIEYYDKLFAANNQNELNFWSSNERISGDEYLEIDLGSCKAVNYISFETTHKPLVISIDYDTIDDTRGRRLFFPVVPKVNFPFSDRVTYSTEITHPWEYTEFNFTDITRGMIYTRYLRIKFARTDVSSPFINAQGIKTPFSVDVRNLRVGRSVFIDDDNHQEDPDMDINLAGYRIDSSYSQPHDSYGNPIPQYYYDHNLIDAEALSTLGQ